MLISTIKQIYLTISWTNNNALFLYYDFSYKDELRELDLRRKIFVNIL